MKVLLFHPTLLPPRDYGGIERVVLWLARGLVERGHQVLIAAQEGSQLPRGCALIPVQSDRSAYADVLPQIPDSIDLVHFMAPLSQSEWESVPFPRVLTVHGNGKPGEIFPKNSIFLSRNHAKRHRAEVFVYNGIDPAEFQFRPQQKEDYFLFLSKTNWSVKNLKGAMRLARRARVSLRISGGNGPLSAKLSTWLTPHFFWEGPVFGEKKARLLAQAQALLFPVVWPEPFGLVAVEAMMSGTPVIANPRGSLIELLPPNVGYLPETEEAWIEIVSRHRTSLEQAERCRHWAMEKFHYLVMTDRYLEIYQKILRKEELHTDFPVADNWRVQK